MSKVLQVVVRTGSEKGNQTHNVVQGEQTTIRAVQGARYQLKELVKKDAGPEQIRSKRVGKNLHITLEGKPEVNIVIEDYYDANMVGDSSIYGVAKDGQMYEYIPEDPSSTGLIANLADGGVQVGQVLGGSPVESEFVLSALPAVAASGGVGAGWLAGGAAAAAVAGGGGGGGSTSTPASTSIDVIQSAAQNNNAVSAGAVTQAVYLGAGVTGVNSSNLSMINGMLDTASINGASVSSTAQVQALVNAVNKIQLLANGVQGDGSVSALNATDVQALGLSLVLDNAADISLLNCIQI
jgi:hypothetical protein